MTDASLTALRGAVDPAGWIDDPLDMAAYLHEQRGRFSGGALAVVRPSSTEQVAAVVTAARAAGVQLVPQGGNTGLVGASMSYPGERAIVLSLQRMNRIRELDVLDYSATVEAGCILANVQAAAGAGRPAVSLEPGVGGQLHDRRPAFDQCRRHDDHPLREYARADTGHRGSDAGMVGSGTGSGGCIRTIPATTSSICSSAARGRSESSPPRC